MYIRFDDKLNYTSLLNGSLRWSIAEQKHIERHYWQQVASLLYKTNRSHVVVLPDSNRPHKTSKCGENISDTLRLVPFFVFVFVFFVLTTFRGRQWFITKRTWGTEHGIHSLIWFEELHQVYLHILTNKHIAVDSGLIFKSSCFKIYVINHFDLTPGFKVKHSFLNLDSMMLLSECILQYFQTKKVY